MPQSPATPSRRRRSSGFSLNLGRSVSQTSVVSPTQRSHSRKSSINSVRSSHTTRPGSALDRSQEFGLISEAGDGAGNGLGSLADELAEEEWDEDAEAAEEQPASMDGAGTQHPPTNGAEFATLSPSNIPPVTNGRQRKRSPTRSDYDGSDYGDSDDLEEVQGISESLESRMAAVEALARQGTGDYRAKETFTNVANQLRDLSSQADVETHITRLSTTSTALSTQLAHQSRLISTLMQPLTSPLAPPPSEQVTTEVPPMITQLLLSLPQPSLSPLASIQSLHDTSAELITALSQLTDTLQMSRQTTNDASRRLRTAAETVGKLKTEFNEADEGRVWLERGNWEEQLKKRKAAEVCREVIDGFETVCESWRERLAQSDTGTGIEVGAA